MEPVVVSPAPGGAHNWNPIAFNPATGLVYLAAKNGTQGLHAPDPKWKYDPQNANLGADARYEGPLLKQLLSSPPPKGELLAWDPVGRRAAWRTPYPVLEGGGVLTTAANLVFQGRSDGILAAYRATDGKQVWQFDAGTGIMAPPVTYSVDGVQYVSVMAGWGGPEAQFNAPNIGPTKPGYGRILTFALGAKATLTPRAFARTGPPTPAIAINATPDVIKEGGLLYAGNCMQCHGFNVVAGSLPDLRYSTRQVHEQFEAIVLGGARATLGMPPFKDLLKPDQVKAIQAFVLWRAKEDATAKK
jgi:mono/diheme cytochrome c family protein